MIRTQIQIPDALYQDLKSLAAAQEWSLAEALRRGAELLLRAYPGARSANEAWTWPVLALGAPLVADEDLRGVANEPDLQP